MASYKTEVIERLFFDRWDDTRLVLRDPVVTLADVQAEIRAAIERGARASDKNAANFIYDIIRKPSANRMWPETVFDAGYTGRQLVGTGQCFEFVRLPPDATEPFPNLFAPSKSTRRLHVQSLSLPLPVRQLAPTDEMAILQIAVSLRLLETHFALLSDQAVIDLTLLQLSIRFSNVVIDGLLVATIDGGNGRVTKALVTCEAKQQEERILEDRIVRQIQAAADMPLGHDLVIPTVVQRAQNCSIYVAEFEPISVQNALQLSSLTMSSSALYELAPPIAGF